MLIHCGQFLLNGELHVHTGTRRERLLAVSSAILLSGETSGVPAMPNGELSAVFHVFSFIDIETPTVTNMFGQNY